MQSSNKLQTSGFLSKLRNIGHVTSYYVRTVCRCLGSRALVPANPDVLEYLDEPDPLARADDAPSAHRGGRGCSVPEGDGGAEGGSANLTLRGLVLQVLLDCADMPFPNMTHLLLGYYVQGVRFHSFLLLPLEYMKSIASHRSSAVAGWRSTIDHHCSLVDTEILNCWF